MGAYFQVVISLEKSENVGVSTPVVDQIGAGSSMSRMPWMIGAV